MREYAANAIDEVSTRAAVDLDRLIDAIVAGRDDEELTWELNHARGTVGNDLKFWRNVILQIRARREALELAETMSESHTPGVRPRL